MSTDQVFKPAGLLLRLAAMFYDSLIVIALLFMGTYLILPLYQGQAIPSGNYLYQTYLVLLIALFFVGFWYSKGQTLGMLAWKIKLVSQDGSPINFFRALLRFIFAIPCLLFFGLGFFYLLFNEERQSLYDQITKTRLVRTH